MKISSFVLDGLKKEFRMGNIFSRKRVRAVNNLNISIVQEEPWILSIVGASGSGKSTVARIILRLIRADEGIIKINGQNSEEILTNRKDFLKCVQPIFQNPFSTFNSRRRVENYLFETVVNLGIANSKRNAMPLIDESLKNVGLSYGQVKGKFPNQFSGGELQRISIARALLIKPSIIVADEPVAMIDASRKVSIVNLFREIKQKYGICIIYITHELSTAYYVSDYVAAMLNGEIIEFGTAKDVLDNPQHPYTRSLLDSIPRLNQKWKESKDVQSEEPSAMAARGSDSKNIQLEEPKKPKV